MPLFLVHFACYASSLTVKDPAQRLSRILPFGSKRQFALSYEPVSSAHHTVFDKFMFIAAGAFGLHHQTLIELLQALGSVFQTLGKTLAFLIEVLSATETTTH
jgi:hypothetical protein